MKINALTVSVNYHDELQLMIPRVKLPLASWTIITSTQDKKTAEIARNAGINCHVTDIFYLNGAKFNKGAAMEEARVQMPWKDWILFLDSDIVPEEKWFEKVCAARPIPGNLYSSKRRQCHDFSLGYRSIDDPSLQPLPDAIGVGYFQLFHVSDPHLRNRPGPIIETQWAHAGNYDDRFRVRWPDDRRKDLKIRLVHLGKNDNWCGKGNELAMQAVREERKRRGGRWDHEVIQPK